MPNSFNSAYLATRADKEKTEREKYLAELDKSIAEAQPAPQQKPQPQAPSAPKKETSPGVLQETKRAVMGGVQDAVYNVTHMADEFAGWLDDNFLHLRSQQATPTWAKTLDKKDATYQKAEKTLQEQTSLAGKVSGKAYDATKVTQPETTAGKLARGLVSFGTTFAATAAATGGMGAGGVVANLGRGAIADFAGQDPTDGNLSNLILDVTKDDPFIGKEVFKLLSTDPNDSAAWNRSKNVLEGMGLGLAADGLVKAVKWGVGKARAAGKDPVQELAGAAKEAHVEDLTAHAIDTTKAPDMALADQINLVTGVSGRGPNKFQKALDMKAAVAEADKAKPLDYTQPGSPKEAPTEPSLVPKDSIPFETPAKAVEGSPSFPEAWSLVEKDPSPRKVFFDTEDGTLTLSKQAEGPHQMDLDLSLPEVMAKAEKSPEERTMLEGYKELQEKVLAAAPKVTDDVAKASSDLEERITKAQARVDALLEEGRDSTAAQKVLDGLLRKKDEGLFDHATKLSGKDADKLASNGDPLVDAIVANDEKIQKAIGKSQGGYISPSLLANMASMQAGAVTGYLSAEDDATFADRLTAAGIGSLAGLGIKVGASRVLKGSERALADNPSPVVKQLSQPHLTNIAPISATAKPQPVIRMGGIAKLGRAIEEGNLDQVAKEVKDDAFNFARIDTEDDVKELFNATEAAFQKEIDKARGGAHVSFDQIKEMAEMTGGGLKSLEELYQGTEGLASRFYAHRAMLVASAEKVTELARLAREGGTFDIVAANKQLKLHALIQAKVNGAQTEIARAMAAMRMTASSADFAVNEANALVRSLGGHEAQIKFFSDLASIDTAAGLNKAIRMGAMARTRSALVESITMGKLWAPTTHVANFTGNALVAIGTLAEKAGAAAIGTVLRNTDDAVKAGEVKAQLFGMLGGLSDALGVSMQGVRALGEAGKEAVTGNFKQAADILRNNADEFGTAYAAGITGSPTGRSTMHMTLDQNMESMGAISARNFNLNPDEFFGKFVDAFGTLTRVPGHALAFGDEIFWTMQYRGELRAQAYRKAVQEGTDGEALIARVAALVDNPTPDMRGFAIKAAEDGTFTAPLGAFGQATMNVVDKANIGMLPVGRIIVPFVKTPANIMRYAFERTPLGVLSGQVREELLAGGARRDLALSRIVVGSGLMAMASSMAAGWDINGTPIKLIGGGDRTKGSEKLGGIQQYSIQVGDKFYSFNRLDPFGMFLGLTADMKDISGHLGEEDAGKMAVASALAISRNITSKSYLKGIGDLVDAFTEATKGNTKAIESWFYNQGAGMVPFTSAMNTAKKLDDPVQRQVWDMMDAMKAKVPGYSQDVPPVRNLFGEEVTLKGGLGPDIMSPVMTSELSSDPAAREIARLNIDLRQPPRSLSPAPGAPPLDLDKWQYDKLTKTAGEIFKSHVTPLIQEDRFKALTEGNDDFLDGKEKVIKDLHARSKMEAVKRLLAEDPELKKKWVETRQKAAGALTGASPVLPF